MIKRTLAILFSLIIVISTSACSTYIHAAIALPITESGYQSFEVSIAVDLFGVKHIARTECIREDPPPYPCKLIYTRVAPGLNGLSETAYSWIPTSSEYVHDVDIAVTDSGMAYIVYRHDYRLGASVASELFYTRSDALGVPVLIEGSYEAHGRPIAVARGDNVYIAYEVLSGGHTHLRYRQLNNPSVGGWVDNRYPTTDEELQDAVTAWNGKFYVVYHLGDGLNYSDNYGVTGDMTNHVYVSTYHDSIADIDVNGSPEMVYIIYDDTRYFPGFSNGLFINYCRADSCTSQTIAVIPMPHPELWRLQGNPQVIADTISTAYYVITARTDANPNINVYAGLFQVGPTPESPIQMTNTPETEVDAHICLTFSINPVIAWRTDLGAGYYGDIHEYGYFSGSNTVRKTTSGREESEMACNADWGAGIWNEETGVGKQAWVSFNTYPAVMPIIKK